MADFFERQDAARRNTTRLVLLFAAAVVGLVAAVDLLVVAAFGYLGRASGAGLLDWSGELPGALLIASAGTVIVIGGGSLFKIAQLRGGGHVVAESLGGRRLNADTADPDERRVLNVVEEMALASGVPTPPVFLLDQEDGINAFAAGFAPSDAVIGVTRGLVSRLDRDELQGVVAHEFSHILNGDMRLNIRLMGLLHGILIVGMIGYFLLRSAAFSGHARRRSKDGSPLPILALGAGLMAIGFVGTFFGNLIQAAVSRQREFLADASAVQFTRLPGGLAGALRKIGALTHGSSIRNPNAPEASHLFFGRATRGVSALWSTHPPLAERIRRIDPSWDGSFPTLEPAPPPGRAEGQTAPRRAAPETMGRTMPAAGVSGLADAGPVDAPAPAPAALVDGVGRPTAAHLAYAANLIEHLPPAVIAAAREPYGARALVYVLLIDRDAAPRRLQLAHLESAADPDVYREVIRLMPLVDGLDPRARLPVLELALPSLRALTPRPYAAFRDRVHALVAADAAIDLFEWSLQRIVIRDLEMHFGHVAPPRVRHRALAPILPQCEVLLSTLAHVGHRDPEGITRAFGEGVSVLRAPDLRLRTHEHAGLDALNEALVEIEAAAPTVKREVLLAAAACVASDRRITVSEAELLRAIAGTLGCPMPPLVGRETGAGAGTA